MSIRFVYDFSLKNMLLHIADKWGFGYLIELFQVIISVHDYVIVKVL